MALEWKVLLGLLVVAILVTWRLVPREKNREFQIVFLFAQSFTWLALLLFVELGRIRFPVREFPYATDTGFAIHFFIDPTLVSLLALYYPQQRSWTWKGLYYLLGAGAVMLIPFGLQRYTNYIESVKQGAVELFVVCLLYVVSTNLFYRWFRKAYWSATQKEGA